MQEAKRQVFGRVGIDGIAGPSELMVIAGESAELEWVALDLCAQAEHGADSPLVAAAVETRSSTGWPSGWLKRWRSSAPASPTPPLALVARPRHRRGRSALANAFAPEHLAARCRGRRAILAASVTTAGCVFVGEASGTAFGDYAAGSNHVLPTGGAGRFQGPLGPAHVQAPASRL